MQREEGMKDKRAKEYETKICKVKKGEMERREGEMNEERGRKEVKESCQGEDSNSRSK